MAALPFQVGDLVTIAHCPSNEDVARYVAEGWNNSWIGEMDTFVGRTARVEAISRNGVRLSNLPCWWPPQVLCKGQIPDLKGPQPVSEPKGHQPPPALDQEELPKPIPTTIVTIYEDEIHGDPQALALRELR